MNYLKSIGYSDSSGDIIDEAMNVQNIYGQMEKELFIKVELDRIYEESGRLQDKEEKKWEKRR